MQNLKRPVTARQRRALCGLGYGLAAVIVLLIGMLLSGCVSALVGSRAYSELTPEQIKELQNLQIDIYACTTIAGPPPAGKLVYVLVPRLDKKPDIRFGENCQIR